MAEPTPTAAPGGRLLSGDVDAALRAMSVPMLVGMVAMIAVNLVDTWWVSRLGTGALAAMTFTFPVEAVVLNIAFGLMVGTSVAVARAVGSGQADEARWLTTHATVLALGVVAVLSGLGLTFQEPLFRAMGAEGPLLDDIQRYMTPWFIGVPFLVVPMIANGALRAVGDAQTPMRVMVAAALVNAVLAPVLLFGWGPIPAYGLAGAAIAGVIARFVTMVVVFVVLLRRTSLLGLAGTTPQRLLRSWWTVLQVAGPAAITNAIGPFAVGLLTVMLARHGPAALAAWGIGARVDAVLLLVPNALAGGLSPFVGQNWAAHLRARVADALRRTLVFTVVWGLGATALLAVLAPWVATLFTADPAVQAQVTTYLRIVPFGYAFVGAASICASTFNAVDRAMRASLLAVLRSLGIGVPLAWAGDTVAGPPGLLAGLVVASAVTAWVGVRWMRAYLWPLGDKPAGVGAALDADALRVWLARHDPWTGLAPSAPTVLALEGVRAYPLGNRRVGLYVGARELLNLHASGTLDLPLPGEIGENLVRLGVVQRHPSHEHNGRYRLETSATPATDTVAWLIGLSHLLYALSQRGAADPITQAEMATYTRTPQCVAAMTAAAARWDAVAPA